MIIKNQEIDLLTFIGLIAVLLFAFVTMVVVAGYIGMFIQW